MRRSSGVILDRRSSSGDLAQETPVHHLAVSPLVLVACQLCFASADRDLEGKSPVVVVEIV